MKNSAIGQHIRVLDPSCILEKFDQVIFTQVGVGIRTNGGLSYPFLFDNRTVTVKELVKITKTHRLYRNWVTAPGTKTDLEHLFSRKRMFLLTFRCVWLIVSFDNLWTFKNLQKPRKNLKFDFWTEKSILKICRLVQKFGFCRFCMWQADRNHR